MRRIFGVLALALALLALVAILRAPTQRAAAAGAFSSSEQCRGCHEQQYAEWSGSWHAHSWSDPEVRALSNDFANADCIDCHAPQPVFETGIGQRVLPRSSRRGEGVDCISCHALPAGHSSGGRVAGTRNAPDAACAPIALRDLGSSAFCAACHDQHDTTKQWRATDYAARGIGCVECHMPEHGHALLGGHDIELVRKAVEFRGRAQGDHWLVEVENVGAGHHFPTEERARAADVFWRPLDGAEHPWTQVYRFRSPYHHEALPDTLLPAHETRPIPIADAPASAPIEVALFYSLKPYWADPEHPDPEREARLVKRLELRP
jgi:nitrate/TMAO reductase-like tetraheme cytochrome c subunit